jgi:hypothetical protein
MNARVIIASLIPAALLMALIYGARGTWRDIRARRWVWAAVGALTALAAISGLILVVLVLTQPAW